MSFSISNKTRSSVRMNWTNTFGCTDIKNHVLRKEMHVTVKEIEGGKGMGGG